MDYFSWMSQEEDLTSASLTVRAQVLPPDDQDRLIHDIFFPRRDVNSTKLSTITDVDFRPAADRREWNVRGRYIPIRTPDLSKIQFIPVESYFKYEEEEIQAIVEQTFGEDPLFRRLIGADYPRRVDGLVNANRRRLEFDAFTAWPLGTVTVMNPQLGGTATFSYGFDTARYQTAGTAWNNGATNAYNELLAWVEDGREAIGGGYAGVALTQAHYNEIQTDAPQGALLRKLTRAELRDQISQDTGVDFQFYIIEHQLDKAVDGGVEFTRTKVWPNRIALVPAGIQVGYMAYAPIARAYSLARLNPDAEIDVRGMTVFREIANGGRELTTECQVNAAPVPDERLMWVMNPGF